MATDSLSLALDAFVDAAEPDIASAPRLVGAVGACVEARRKMPHKAKVFGLHVVPDARRRGTAQALMKALLGELVLSGSIALVQLTLTEDNEAALSLYRCYLAKLHLWRRLDERGG